MWTLSTFRMIYRIYFYEFVYRSIDRLCGLVVRVPGYTSRGPGFDSRRYQIFWEVVGLERGPLNLVSIIEELFGRNNKGYGLESREYGSGCPLRWLRDTLYPQKLALTSPTIVGRSVGIVSLRTKATEFLFLLFTVLLSRYECCLIFSVIICRLTIMCSVMFAFYFYCAALFFKWINKILTEQKLVAFIQSLSLQIRLDLPTGTF
jgi:hypothetical protein